MKGSWKLCVISGSLMVFAVLGVLVLLGHSVSSADSEKKEFPITQNLVEESETGESVSGESVSGEGTADEGELRNAVELREDTDDKGAESDSTDKVTKKDKKKDKKKAENSSKENDVDNTNVQASVGVELEGEQSLGAEIAYYAKRFLGLRYVYGGTELPNIESITYTHLQEGEKSDVPDTAGIEATNKRLFSNEYGVDSSGFVMKVFEHFDIKLPRSCAKQAEGKDILIKVKDVQPGDILFYGAGADKITHCGIYVGDGKVVHASSQKKMVTLSDMNYRRIVKVKRVYED